MKPILEIQNISKKFYILHEKRPYLSLRDSLTSLFKSNTLFSEEFYALKDVSFNVFQGESIGIIGKNGAGKSTLLKILSKITPPSSGKIISRGRIASLLEVGTGFHAELSGRENIFLNGSILGMKRKEIQMKFDEIVDFSGTEKFLDTPLKHYSSGMQVRLAFSVAAFLDPEILIIDEVLAVGDAEFQKKCIGKMEDVSKKDGKTILFVSHNLYALQNLCPQSILLHHGQLIRQGKTPAVVSAYGLLNEQNKIQQGGTIRMGKSLSLRNFTITETSETGKENPVQINFILQSTQEEIIFSLSFHICNQDDFRIAIIDCRTISFPLKITPFESIKTTVTTPDFPLVEGSYNIGVYAETLFFKGNVNNFHQFDVSSKIATESEILKYPKEVRGVLELNCTVNFENTSA